MTTDRIHFILNGRDVVVAGLAPTTTLLNWLREEASLTGTKEGCAEGDCGACTVLVADMRAGRLRWRSLNACLQLLPTLHGKAVFTIESLAAATQLHPAQRAMVDCHGSQCGFCTPGFVISLAALLQTEPAADERAIADALSGNLCRCTGYRPIVAAARRMYALDAPPATGLLPPPAWHPQAEAGEAVLIARLTAIAAQGSLQVTHASGAYAAPRSLAEFDTLIAATPEATLLAGGTDVGLWITKQFRALPRLLDLMHVTEFAGIVIDEGTLEIGAAVSLDDAFRALTRDYPEAAELHRRFGSRPIRNAGTLCGNIANGSPIGDSMPALIALGATLLLRHAGTTRELALEDFYPADRSLPRLAPGEIVQAVHIPLRQAGAVSATRIAGQAPDGLHFRTWKVSRRHDQDISTVCAGFALTIADGVVRAARLAFGGMAATPQRAMQAESVLLGRPFDLAALAATQAAIAEDFSPISDLRASAGYRLAVAQNLLARLHRSVCGLEDSAPSLARPSTAEQTASTAAEVQEGGAHGASGLPLPHESALLHVTGAAQYTDDLPEPRGTLHAALALTPHAHARLAAIDIDAARAVPGVVAVLTAADIPGANDFGAVVDDDPILAEGEIRFHGQPFCLVVATSVDAARRAARLARAECAPLPALLTIDDALAAGSRVQADVRMHRGEPDAAIARAPCRLSGSVRCGGQDHFYLEGQIALAIPGDDGTMHVHSATQHPGEVQLQVAKALGVDAKDVVVTCRRMGGGFGGKESQPGQIATLAAIAARHAGRPVKLRLDRDTDMIMTGKRHDFRIDYEAGFDTEGHILGLRIRHAMRAGHSTDLSGAIADRALFHADNAYYLPDVAVDSLRLRTHTVSNTAFRGFGGPQGMFGIEEVMDTIARALHVDPLDVRKRNLYGVGERDVTPYGQRIADNILPQLLDTLEADSDYRARRAEIEAWNAASAVIKRGLALTPVKFGISFTTTHLNQAGALLQVYKDGTVLLNHGGTEMGQGLYTKVAQVVADELQTDLDRIRVSAADTSKVPNASATAASSGTDLNGKAAQQAARKIKERLARFAAQQYRIPQHEVRFRRNHVVIGERTVPFAELVRAAWKARVSLSATGFYRTPDIHFDPTSFTGHPFYYFAYGAACAEVAVDSLTGEVRVLRADLLHDAGRSLNPALDLGQIEGGFMQGLGWLTMEELRWDDAGRLLTHAPSTYKIPAISDLPADFRVRMWPHGENAADTVFRSKATGEPPLMLALSVWHAIKDAIAAVADHRLAPQLDAPATAEEILRSITELRARDARGGAAPGAAPSARAATISSANA